jgi:hypothetical protein
MPDRWNAAQKFSFFYYWQTVSGVGVTCVMLLGVDDVNAALSTRRRIVAGFQTPLDPRQSLESCFRKAKDEDDHRDKENTLKNGRNSPCVTCDGAGALEGEVYPIDHHDAFKSVSSAVTPRLVKMIWNVDSHQNSESRPERIRIHPLTFSD